MQRETNRASVISGRSYKVPVMALDDNGGKKRGDILLSPHRSDVFSGGSAMFCRRDAEAVAATMSSSRSPVCSLPCANLQLGVQPALARPLRLGGEHDRSVAQWCIARVVDWIARDGGAGRPSRHLR